MGTLETWPPVYILKTLVGQIGSPTTHLEAQSGKPKEGSAQPGRAAPWSDDQVSSRANRVEVSNRGHGTNQTD